MTSPRMRIRVMFDSENPTDLLIYNLLLGKSLRARSKIVKFLANQAIKGGSLAKSDFADDVEYMDPKIIPKTKNDIVSQIEEAARSDDDSNAGGSASKGIKDLADFGG